MNSLQQRRAEEILAKASGFGILVVGDLMLDRYLIGQVERISPEAPVPVVLMQSEALALGGAGNVAANVVALGASCEIVGCVGDDSDGDLLLEELEKSGIGTRGVVRVAGRPTTVKTRIMAQHQQVTRVDREDTSDISGIHADRLRESVRELLPGAHGLVLEDYNKGVLTSAVIRDCLAAGKAASIPSVVDPKRLRFFEYGGATVFKPNSRELEDALGERLEVQDPDWLESVRARLDVEVLLLTLGEGGMAAQSHGEGYLRIPTMARDVYDVSGAGDTVTAVMAVGLAVGATPLEAAELANHAAAVEVGKAGVATVSPEEILKQQQAYFKQALSSEVIP